VPLKVVPMFIDEQVVELQDDTPPVAPQQAEPAPRRPRPWVGLLAITLGLAAAIVQVIAVTTASDGAFEAGIVLGYLAIIIAIAAVVAGIAAIIVRRGRRIGVIGIVIGLIANPLLLLGILRFFAGPQG
jgi:hypothetical protein